MGRQGLKGVRPFAVSLFAIAATGCMDFHVRTAELFRAATDAGDYEEARTYLAVDPRTWYGSREGEGDPLTLGGGRWRAWDEEFNGVSELGEWHVGEGKIYAIAVENNDYYHAIEREPSPWMLTYYFDEDGKITGRMVSAVPEELQPQDAEKEDRGEEFDQWLRDNDPEEYSYLRPGGQIDPTEDRAARTRAKLEEWRREVGLPPIGE